MNSINPWRLEGQKTAAFEICDQLGGIAPDWFCLPVGNAGNITAYWAGFKQYDEVKSMGADAVITAAQRKELRKALKRQLVKRSSLLKIVSAWIITVPVSAVMAALFYYALRGMMLP